MHVVAIVSMAELEVTVMESNDLEICAMLVGPEGGIDREIEVSMTPIDGTAVRK